MAVSNISVNFEQRLSGEFHRDGVPILVSPLLLRSYGAGQIDLCKLSIERVANIDLVLNYLFFECSSRCCYSSNDGGMGVFSFPFPFTVSSNNLRINVLEAKASLGVSKKQKSRIMMSALLLEYLFRLPVVYSESIRGGAQIFG